MTRKENSGVRDLTFNNWIREKLPDSATGFMVSDIDFFMYNWKTKRCMFIESKSHNSTMREWQIRMYSMLTSWVKKGIDGEWTFYGYHVVTFENTSFNNGKVSLDGKEVTENELTDFLSMT